MRFIQAANYTPVAHRDINVITIHDMEAPEKPTTAEGCAMFFHNQPRDPSGKTGSSAHYSADSDSIVQSVRDHDVAWAAPGANHDGLHIEHAGYASQTKRDWADEFSTKMLHRSAKLVARKCKHYHIPIRFLTPEMVGAGESGITGHLQITRSGIGGAAGTHTDPGENFPWGRYIRYVKAYAAGHVPADFVHGETK